MNFRDSDSKYDHYDDYVKVPPKFDEPDDYGSGGSVSGMGSIIKHQEPVCGAGGGRKLKRDGYLKV